MNYLYNGVELPALPEWDKEAYPYAVIAWNYVMAKYMFMASSAPILRYRYGVDGDAELEGFSVKAPRIGRLLTDGVWGDAVSLSSNCVMGVKDNTDIIWSNTDLINEDGSTYLSASDPVPVPQLNPAALMQGFFGGMRQKEQRAKRLLHDHTYSAEVTAPTCTEKGYTTCTCATCGHRYVSNQVPATGHDYVSEVIEPTTKAQGYTQHTCSRCGDSYKDNYTERLPVAYSYNGTELPALPEYDTTAYPYAFIFTNSSGTTNFYYSNQPFHGYSSVMDLVTNLTDCTLGTYKISNGAWIVGTAPQEYATKVIATNIPFWANYDVLDSREQLWCAASDPVPIYE